MFNGLCGYVMALSAAVFVARQNDEEKSGKEPVRMSLAEGLILSLAAAVAVETVKGVALAALEASQENQFDTGS